MPKDCCNVRQSLEQITAETFMLDFLLKNRRRISVLFLLIFFLAVLVSQTDRFRSENWFTSLVQNLAYPFQAVFHFAETQITETWRHYVWLVDTEAENQELRKKVAYLEELNAENREMRIAYKRLLELLDFKRKDPNKKVFAEVVVEINKPFSRLLVINKGSDDGIRPNFGVVTPEGIVGKIQSVTALQSIIQLITDPRAQFPVLIQRTRTKAMIQVRDGNLVISRVPRRQEIYEKDRIVTSGLAGVFPKGFPVGQVSSIQKKEFGLFQSLTVTPAVDLNKIEAVTVILQSVQNIHRPLFTDIE